MSENKGYTSVELPATTPGIGYSLKHRNAVSMLIDYYCKRAVGKRDGNGVEFTKEDYEIMHNRGLCHDMDKILAGLSYPQITADYYHRMFNGHHIEGFIEEKCKYDWIEMIFDWESAAYTKPDKGKSAYEVATSFNADLYPMVEPYLKLFGFMGEQHIVKEIKDKVSGPVYESDLVDAFVNYIHTTHLHLLEYVARIDDVGYMRIFNKPTPFRHKSTQKPGGTYHQRPNAYVQQEGHGFALKHEMIKGVIDAQIYDMDKICKIKVKDIPQLNAQGKQVYDELKKHHGGTR